MPIYAYRCEACGFAKDVLQKLSDPQLTECPTCGQSTFKKQLTAAGFQLKGTGWYATDFRGGTPAPSAPAVATDTAGSADAGSKSDTASSAAPASQATSSPAANTTSSGSTGDSKTP